MTSASGRAYFAIPQFPSLPPLASGSRPREPVTIELLYGDNEGGQRVVTRFVLTPRPDGAWVAAAGRYWNIDRTEPR